MKQPWLAVLVCVYSAVVLAVGPNRADADTLVLETPLSASLNVTLAERFQDRNGHGGHVYITRRPPEIRTPYHSQAISDFDLNVEPKPDRILRQTDIDGNLVYRIEFDRSCRDITITRSFSVKETRRPYMTGSLPPFPVKHHPPDALDFLNPTSTVQCGEENIGKLSRLLTDSVTSQQEAVAILLEWIMDNIRFDPDAVFEDAAATLKAGCGRSTGVANLAAALLRSIRIPARVVAGVAAGDEWLVRQGEKTWSPVTETGLKSWVEVFYPGVGWVPSDPMLTKDFIPPAYVTLSYGVDSGYSGFAEGYNGENSVELKSCRLSVQAVLMPAAVASSGILERPKNLALMVPFTPPPPGSQRKADGKAPPASHFKPYELDIGAVRAFDRTGPVTWGNFPEDAGKGFFIGGGREETASVAEENGLRTGGTVYQSFILSLPLELARAGMLVKNRMARTPLRISIFSIGPGEAGHLAVETGRITASPGPDKNTEWLTGVFDSDIGVFLTPGRYWMTCTYENGAPDFAAIFGNPFGFAEDTVLLPGRGGTVLLNEDVVFRLEGFWRTPAHLKRLFPRTR